jgi:hypothetical protein
MSFEDVRVGSYCFMDYETTGVDTSCQTNIVPIQIGCVFATPELDKILEYERLIKWNKIMQYDDWPIKWQPAARVHKIPLEKVKDEGLWPYEVRQELIEITGEIQDLLGTKKSCAIISDAPNFEMFFTEMLWGNKGAGEWPFYKNAWSVYPLFQIMKVEALYGRKPHDALDDARMLFEGMQECLEKSKVL